MSADGGGILRVYIGLDLHQCAWKWALSWFTTVCSDHHLCRVGDRGQPAAAMEDARRWLEESQKTGFVPIGQRAMMRGTLGDDFIVGIGADTFVSMDRARVEEHIRTRLGEVATRARGETVQLLQDGEQEIIEELTAADLALLEQRERPRRAHVAGPGAKPAGRTTTTLEEDMGRLDVGPVRAHVVERRAPSRAADPSETVIRAHVKESLFKRRTALGETVRGGRATLLPMGDDPEEDSDSVE